MAFVKFDHRVKYKGRLYESGQKIKVDDFEAASLKEQGAQEVESRAGRPKKQPDIGV